jgi:uncharacterized protein (DUF2147 family)
MALFIYFESSNCFMHSLLTLFFSLFLVLGYSQETILGKWKTIDDETQEAKSVVEIFEKDGMVFGKIVKLFRKPGEDPDPICDECDSDDARYKKKIIGMEILRDMRKADGQYSNGNILDPNNGKVYTCKLWLEGTDLKLRGYWGPFYRTQTWIRIP